MLRYTIQTRLKYLLRRLAAGPTASTLEPRLQATTQKLHSTARSRSLCDEDSNSGSPEANHPGSMLESARFSKSDRLERLLEFPRPPQIVSNSRRANTLHSFRRISARAETWVNCVRRRPSHSEILEETSRLLHFGNDVVVSVQKPFARNAVFPVRSRAALHNFPRAAFQNSTPERGSRIAFAQIANFHPTHNNAGFHSFGPLRQVQRTKDK
jgi:hypothetical protein